MIGYQKATHIAKAEGLTPREAALASGHGDADTFGRACDPATMVGNGLAGA